MCVAGVGHNKAVGYRIAVQPNGVVCGSRDEVANVVELNGGVNRGAFDAVTTNQTTPNRQLAQQRLSVWMAIAMNAEDQLRQKTAWALSQILVISPFDISDSEVTESFVVSCVLHSQRCFMT